MVKVKICGIANFHDAHMIIDCGITTLGFIFTENSKRFNDPKQSKWIAGLPDTIEKVGVFQNQSVEFVRQTALDLKLNAVQLHGSEDSEFINLLGLNTWKAISIDDALGGKFPKSDFISYYLIDTVTPNHSGGTGIVFDWHLLDELHLPKPFIVAGGINSENVSDLLNHVSVTRIDVSSGVESSPGKKDQKKIKQLLDNIQLKY